MRASPSHDAKVPARWSWPMILLSLAIVAALALLLGPCQNAASPGPPGYTPARAQPRVQYFGNELLGVRDGQIYIRGRFRITGPPERQYQVRFQLLASHRETMQYTDSATGWWWAGDTVVMPKGQWVPRLPGREPWVYFECDGAIPVKKLDMATNLPRGRRNEVRAQCDIWDMTQKKYLGWGGDFDRGLGSQAIFLVRTDENGKVISIKEKEPERFPGTRSRAGVYEKCILVTKHLQLQPGVTVEREGSSFALLSPHPEFRVGSRYRVVGYPGIFKAVDTKAKARELAELSVASSWSSWMLSKVHGADGWIVKTPSQYRAVKDFLRKKKGDGFFFAPWEPSSFGFTVEEGKNGSYIARVLHYIPRCGIVNHRQMTIWPDGRIELRIVPILTDGWVEGWGQMPAMTTEQSNGKAWDPGVRAILAEEGLERIPYRLKSEFDLNGSTKP